MPKKILLCGLLFISPVVYAQEKIDTDRPDQTESAALVPKNYFQAELGFNRESDRGLTTLVHPTALWKYGIGKRVELRLITELKSEETPILIPAGNEIITGLLPIEVGSKIALWKEKGILPKTSLIVHVGIPAISSPKFKTPHAAPNFRFTMAHSLSEKLGLGYNIGAEWDGVSKTPYWIYTLAPGYTISDKWYAYIELFGFIRNNEMPQHSFDGGLGYYINSNIKLDLSAGKGITENARDNYMSLGFSFRINTKNAE